MNMHTYAKRIQGLARGMVVFDLTDHHVTDAPGSGFIRDVVVVPTLSLRVCSKQCRYWRLQPAAQRHWLLDIINYVLTSGQGMFRIDARFSRIYMQTSK